MAQHDYTIANQTFPATRTDLNNVFAAIVSQNSGATAPSTTYAYQLWYDTTTDILKMRNANDDAWVDLFTIDQVADTATASGASAQGSNLIINGAMQVAQRGTSFNSNNAIDYTVDRWGTFANGQITTTQETFTAGQTAVPNEPTHYVRWNVTSYSSGDNFFQKIEDVRTLAGQSATLSFYAKSDTDITTRPRFIQDFGSGGSSDVVTTTDTASITTSWQKFVITTAIPSISGKTIGTSSYLEIELLRVTDTFTGQIDLAQVQLEVGEQATPFEHRNFGDELKQCERYYEKTYEYGTVAGTPESYPTNMGMRMNGFDLASGQRYMVFRLRTEKRARPTNTYYGHLGNSGKISTADAGGTLTERNLGLSVTSTSMVGGGSSNGAYAGLMLYVVSDAEL